jgi:hypothetical protein
MRLLWRPDTRLPALAVPHCRPQLVLSVMIPMFQQLTGINAIM